MQFILYFCSGESKTERAKKKKTVRSPSFSSVLLLANECHSFISTQLNISIVVIFYTRCQTTYANLATPDENGERWTEIGSKTFYAIALCLALCVCANSISTMILSCSVCTLKFIAEKMDAAIKSHSQQTDPGQKIQRRSHLYHSELIRLSFESN